MKWIVTLVDGCRVCVEADDQATALYEAGVFCGQDVGHLVCDVEQDVG